MSNVAVFRNYLQSRDIYMEEVQEESGGVFFRTRQGFDNGGSVVIVAAFNELQDIVDLQILGLASITNPLKKESVHNLLNELNFNYRFSKFLEVEGNISAQYSIHLGDKVLDAEFLMDTLLMLLRSAEENYPKFMKLQWA
ncbi:hypothetical protein Q75_15660 [Bacillus coahuilensis p1.1.43]|uniref:YbjN domain-containing protein n=1 Tax=Bacillus coahuilensis p1.1.43 TaxID=1150625 RepID=A0A147K4R0_9BACI|nr:YbjN domain-containing protein [Bacillus coahuilensis]KUP04425.1 hypothetical protein Q75_15660 [Bacillus coahuilensis p1.1.43]